MAAKKNKIINRRRLKVAEIWERDPEQTQEAIAAILASEFDIKVTRVTVSRDLKLLDQRNLAKSDAVIRAVKQDLTEQYEVIYQKALAAWEKSLEDKKIVTVENTEAESGVANRVKASEKTEGQSGNPALLAQAQAALKAIRDLYGLDAPARQEISGTGGGDIILKVYGNESAKDV